jgi:radical SAM modification target selenobiotic family peptide
MEVRELKKVLAGLCFATLLSGAGLTVAGAASG